MKSIEDIQNNITELSESGMSVGELSDTYHTFNELYHHRCVLTAALFRQILYTWKSRVHEDGTMYDGMFIVGVCTPDGMATYHYDMRYWDIFKVPEIPHAPKFDGHTPEDAINRIQKFFTRGMNIYRESELDRLHECVSEVLDCIPSEKDRESYIRVFILRENSI